MQDWSSFCGLLSAIEAQPKGTEVGKLQHFIDVSDASSLWAQFRALSRGGGGKQAQKSALQNNAAEKAVVKLKTFLGITTLWHFLYKSGLRFSLCLFRYFLKTYVYTPSTLCRDVKFCPNIPLAIFHEIRWRKSCDIIKSTVFQIQNFENTDKKMFT